MREAVIVDAVRTPAGRYGGALKDTRPDDLAACVLDAIVKRTGIDPAVIEDVLLGCGNQAGEDARNIARLALLLAGLPVTVAGQTINRLCGSGLQAINSAAQAIQSDPGTVYIAGGVESMTRAPWVMPKPERSFPRGSVTLFDTVQGWRFINPRLAEMYPPYSMGETAEIVAERWAIGRREQDEFALRSHQQAVAAIGEARFREEITPVPLQSRQSEAAVFTTDEPPRVDTTLARLAALPPVFREGGTVTAGNSCGLSDAAAALLITSQERAKDLGLRPMARIVASAVVGVDPACMGIGPVPATRKVLARAGLALDDLDLVELNEAFAAQALACIAELGLDLEKVNVNGGAIALGHPIGCTGARLMTTLVHELRRRGGHYGLVTMCIGIGQGIATIIERI